MQQRNQEMMKLQKELQSDQQGFEQFVQSLPEKTHDDCIKSYGKDVNKYADCMYKKSKKIEKGLRSFEFKMLFMNHQFDQCTKSTPGSEKCFEEAKKNVQSFINDIKKNII